MLRALAFIVSSSAVVTIGVAQDTPFSLKSGDRVAFYGDSITDNGPYTQLVEIFCACRYPKLDLWFENAGVGGDRVTGGWMGDVNTRLSRDLFARKPTVITVMLGMNDASYRALDQSIFRTYKTGYESIAERIRREAKGANVWLVQPSPYDDITRPPGFEGGYNSVLLQYSDFVRKLASAYNFGTIDLNTPVVNMLKRAKELDANGAQKLIGDRVHPGGAGHFVMAAGVLKAWGASPLVSQTTLDWASGAISCTGGQVTGGKKGTFELLEHALPMPIDRANAEINLMLRASDVEQLLNLQTLTVRNMPTGNFQLLIDGNDMGRFSAEQLGAGIDLSKLETPMMKQSWKVADLTWKLCAARYNRWRDYEVAFAGAVDSERMVAVSALNKYEMAISKERMRTAKPTKHKFEIKLVTE